MNDVTGDSGLESAVEAIAPEEGAFDESQFIESLAKDISARESDDEAEEPTTDEGKPEEKPEEPKDDDDESEDEGEDEEGEKEDDEEKPLTKSQRRNARKKQKFEELKSEVQSARAETAQVVEALDKVYSFASTLEAENKALKEQHAQFMKAAEEWGVPLNGADPEKAQLRAEIERLKGGKQSPFAEQYRKQEQARQEQARAAEYKEQYTRTFLDAADANGLSPEEMRDALAADWAVTDMRGVQRRDANEIAKDAANRKRFAENREQGAAAIRQSAKNKTSPRRLQSAPPVIKRSDDETEWALQLLRAGGSNL